MLQVIHLLTDQDRANDHDNGGYKLSNDQSFSKKACAILHFQFPFQHFDGAKS